MFRATFLVLACLLPIALGQQLQAQDDAVGRDGSILINPVPPASVVARDRRSEQCEIQPDFRNLDGTCTSSTDQLWGSTGRPQDALDLEKSSRNPTGTDLPSARNVSNMLTKQVMNIFNDRGLNELLVFFGQFIDHTFVATPGGNEQMPIEIPEDDPIFGNFTGGVLQFTRSRRVRVETGDDVERPSNSLTGALDLASIYGTSKLRNDGLREFSGGLLRIGEGNLLPRNDRQLTNDPTVGPEFFISGDIRSNEHPVLMALHTLFLREHNGIAQELESLFPDMDDDALYETAKKINTAQFQKIVIDEFYPAIVGSSLPAYPGFDSTARPIIIDVFSTAAFRVGHTMVGDRVTRKGPGGASLPSVSFQDMFFRPADALEPEGIDPFLRGALMTKAQEVDMFVQDSLRNFLFQRVPEFSSGFDLIALNLQRGRDHALPSFVEVQRLSGVPVASGFADISSVVTVQNQLQSVYGTVDRVEAWIGMVAEDHVAGGSMGRTMRAVWMKQFENLRNGDLFWFQRDQQFTAEDRETLPRVAELFQGGSTLREILLRHTGLSAADIPSRVFF